MISLVLLTVTLIVVGIWIVLVLIEARRALRRVNQATEALESLAVKIENSGSTFVGLLEGLSSGVKLVENFQKILKKKKKDGK